MGIIIEEDASNSWIAVKMPARNLSCNIEKKSCNSILMIQQTYKLLVQGKCDDQP